uniref:Transposase n=1 Tax=Strongyloides venezuelensis TaxID=75913 RepID=A0A0K0FDF4_STRVS
MRYVCSRSLNRSPCYLYMTTWENYWKKYFERQFSLNTRRWVKKVSEKSRRDYRYKDVLNKYINLVVKDRNIEKCLKLVHEKYKFPTYIILTNNAGQYARHQGSMPSGNFISVH